MGTVSDFWDDVKEDGFVVAFNKRKMWNEMRMNSRDISDVTGYTYTYLINGLPSKIPFKAFFDVRIPDLKMTVVAADGNNIQPVSVDEFRIGVAETYDVIVEPKKNNSYAIFAQSIDRSGYALGILTSDINSLPIIPQMDKISNLTHADMGMNMEHNMMAMEKENDHQMQNMQQMDHSKHSMHEKHMNSSTSLNKKAKIPITKIEESTGYQTDMRVQNPQYRLNDPGIGLRDNGRRVLSYVDLKSLRSTKEDKYPDREIVLRLTGNMERYMWSINGIAYKDAKPLMFKYGERLRITYINDTMMNHPMHLHGLWSDLETG